LPYVSKSTPFKADDPTNATEGFFLAMAHWQQGNKDKAREWFAKSVKWWKTTRTGIPTLKRFRAEAAACWASRNPGPNGSFSDYRGLR
jgi:hypothetical protein